MRPIFIVLHILFLFSCNGGGCETDPSDGRSMRKDPPRSEELAGLRTLAFGGDTQLGRRLNAHAERRGFEKPFRGIRDALVQADMAVVNLECAIGAAGVARVKKGEGRSYHFRARPENVRILVEAGIDVVSLANNHAMDYGPGALAEGIEILKRAHIAPVGAGLNLDEATAPVYRRAGDAVVAVVGLDTKMGDCGAGPDSPGTNHMSVKNEDALIRRVRNQVSRAREHANLVFLAVHWGRNQDKNPRRQLRGLGRRLIRESGLDGILGSGSHGTQGIEVVDGRPVIWGPGNLLWDSARGTKRLTMVVAFHFNTDGVVWVETVPVAVRDGWVSYADPEDARRFLEELKQQCAELGTPLLVRDDRGWIPVSIGLRPEGFRTPGSPKSGNLPGELSRTERILPKPLSSRPPDVVLSELPASAVPLRVQFDHGIELLGYEMPNEWSKKAGFLMSTYWTAAEPLAESYDIHIHATPLDGEKSFREGGHQPGDWSYSTRQWQKGEVIRDAVFVRAKGCAKGAYELSVQLKGRKGPVPVTGNWLHDEKHRVPLGIIMFKEMP